MGAIIVKGGKKSNNAGYYLQIEPEASFAGGGVYCPQPKILKSIRNDIFNDSSKLKSVINNKEFKTVFPEMYGEKLKTAPRGFPKDFIDIELLNFKSYLAVKNLKNTEIVSNNFLENILNIFKIQKPLNDYLNTLISGK